MFNPNFITKLATTAVIGVVSILGTVNPAEARPNRIVNFTSDNGSDVWLKPIGYNSVEVLVDNDYTKTGFIATMNCSNGDYQWRANTGWSKAAMADVLVAACRY